MANSKGDIRVANPGLEKLLEALQDTPNDFDGSEYGRPAAMAYFGKKLDAQNLRELARGLKGAPPAQQCELAMTVAEAIEAAAPDRAKYFQTDAKTRAHVFSGAKWRSGWVFLMGGGNHAELAQKFNQRSFLVFAQNGANLNNVVDLGPRETAAVYFLQVMVRYAMIWGRIRPGDDHEMGHFLEKDLPGVVVAEGKLTPVEELLLLALMKMGAPAVVPLDYPWDLGRQVRADGVESTLEAATKFPNLRVKDIQGKIIELPAFCDPANIRSEFTVDRTLGGKESFFLLRPGKVIGGIRLPVNRNLAEADLIGVLVEIGDERLDIATSDYLEKDALRGIGAISGIRAEQDEQDGFRIHLARGANPDAGTIAEGLRKWIIYEFPHLKKVKVKHPDRRKCQESEK